MMVTIPKAIQQEANLHVGDTVIIAFTNKKIEIQIPEKLVNKKRYGEKHGTFSIPDFDVKELIRALKEDIYE